MEQWHVMYVLLCPHLLIILSAGISLLSYIEGILPKVPYLPCVSMAGRALLAGYPRHMRLWYRWNVCPLYYERGIGMNISHCYAYDISIVQILTWLTTNKKVCSKWKQWNNCKKQCMSKRNKEYEKSVDGDYMKRCDIDMKHRHINIAYQHSQPGVNTLTPKQNVRHFPEVIFKCISFSMNMYRFWLIFQWILFLWV